MHFLNNDVVIKKGHFDIQNIIIVLEGELFFDNWKLFGEKGFVFNP